MQKNISVQYDDMQNTRLFICETPFSSTGESRFQTLA